MVQKPEIRSWHREEFKAGKLDNIPPHVVELLKGEKKASKVVDERKTVNEDGTIEGPTTTITTNGPVK